MYKHKLRQAPLSRDLNSTQAIDHLERMTTWELIRGKKRASNRCLTKAENMLKEPPYNISRTGSPSGDPPGEIEKSDMMDVAL